MAVIKGLEWTFDTAAEVYEKMRPGYVEELYRDIFQYIPVYESSNVVEIGIGGGQATPPVVKTGCKLTAVEYGEALSEICREKFKEYPRFSVATLKFEDYVCEPDSCDFIYSASAFHWIPEETGYRKVFEMLKSGGVFARFANHPYKDSSAPEEYSDADAKRRAEIAYKYGFTDIFYKLYHRTRTFTADEYITLLGTYSDHIAIEEKTRMKFFSEIKDAINGLGGKITIYDTIDLQLARKP